MKSAAIRPAVHFFACANRRPATDPLGPGCGDAGVAVYGALKAAVAARGAYRAAWVTETRCLGICPKVGATVAVYPRARLLTEVMPEDAVALFAEEMP